ncbi:MAG TPA: DUF4236 domain-containing protein [Candidatus Limnocylindrales bacterium]
MGYFRLFRRIKIAPGVTINVSKSGLSTSFGPKGAKITVGKRGIRRTVGIPGTGMYYTSLSSPDRKSAIPVATDAAPPAAGAPTTWGIRSWVGVLIVVVFLAAVVGSCLGGKTADPAPTSPPAALGLAGQASPFNSTLAPAPTALASPSTTSAPATKKPTVTPKPTSKPRPKPTPMPTTSKLAVKVTALTASVPRNSTAMVSIKTSAGARCSIVVKYESGPSTAAGLVDKTANSTGAISWSWKVGSRTTRGTWPISISCQLGSRSGSVDTSFTVR